MIYDFEINIRASAILGYIGAGGIGQIINDNAYINNNRVGVAIIVIFFTTLVVQLLSNIVRRKLK
jgi:phosphonate transport system permease protein